MRKNGKGGGEEWRRQRRSYLYVRNSCAYRKKVEGKKLKLKKIIKIRIIKNRKCKN